MIFGVRIGSSQYRGRGAGMIGTFGLTKGEIIQIPVGQEGAKTADNDNSGEIINNYWMRLSMIS